MLRSIELFPEDGSPVGRTPFILSVLTLHPLEPTLLEGFPPPRPPSPLSFSRLLPLLGASTSMTNLVTPAFLCPDGDDHDVDGASLGSAIVSSLPLTRSPSSSLLLPLSLLYHEVEWNWSNVPVFLLFCTLGFLLSVWWGLWEFVWGVCVYVCVCIMRLLAVVRVLWRTGCLAVYAVYLFFFDKKGFLPSVLNWFFFFFGEKFWTWELVLIGDWIIWWWCIVISIFWFLGNEIWDFEVENWFFQSWKINLYFSRMMVFICFFLFDIEESFVCGLELFLGNDSGFGFEN